MMKKIDRIFTTCPFYGKRRISAVLKREGHNVGVDLARALMKRMGIEAIYPRPNLSKPHSSHRIYKFHFKGTQKGLIQSLGIELLTEVSVLT
jgi:putative transposase